MKHPFDFPVPGQPPPAGGQGTATESFPAEASPSPSHHRYRLEALRANAGPNLFPKVFDTVEDACAFAEHDLPVTGPHAAWKMTGYRVKEIQTSRVVTTVHWHDPDDPDDPDPF